MIKGLSKNTVCDTCRRIITNQPHVTVQGKKRKLHYCYSPAGKCIPANFERQARPENIAVRTKKFRGQRFDNGQWVVGDYFDGYILNYVDLAESWLSGGSSDHKVTCRAFRVREESVCQYTGVNDKNGKEIFEWDIAEVYGEIRLVEFKNAFWQLELCETTTLGGFGAATVSGHKPLYRYSGKHIEVIGNLLDNPELLG